MENISQYITKLDEFIQLFGKEKLKFHIKTTILEGLKFIKKFLESSPGVISPAIVSDRMKEIEGYFPVWVKNSALTKDVVLIFNNIKSRYIDLVECTDNPKKSSTNDIASSVLSKKPVKEGVIPWHTKKLFESVEVIKADVSYLPIGPCNHYCIVYKVLEDKTYVIPITTDIDTFDGYLIEKSRFFKGKAIYSLYQFPTKMVKERFVLPYDHKSEVNSIFKSLEELLLGSILPKKRIKRKTIKTL